MRSVEVPAPSIRPPQRFRNSARSEISGSRAAPLDGGTSGADSSQQQCLRRSHAGETEGDVGPWEAPGAASTSFPAPASSSFAPIRARPSRCKSMGRAPILHPPGSEVSARPSRASSGAQKRMEARICAAVSPGRVLFEASGHHDVCPLPVRRHTLRPATARAHSTSDSLGTARAHSVPGRAVPPQKRKYAVFRRRYRRRAVQRPSAHHPNPPALLCHIRCPHSAKDTPTICKSRGGCHDLSL